MKDQAIQYLAFDVHRSAIVATARDHWGAIVMRATVPTEASAVLRLVRSAGPRVHVAFEEGTQAQWLHDVVAPHAERVVVCDIRGERKQGNKGDRLDADRLSERLRTGSLRGVFHGAKTLLTLKELVRNYNNLVEDGTRVMQRIKALFRARAIDTPGVSVYRATKRDQWLARLNGGARLRAGTLLAQLDVLLALRPKAKAAMIAEARRQPGWRSLRSIPFLGPVRVAEILAIIGTPFRFRTKRNLWPYVGLAVVTHGSAEQEFKDGKLRRRKKATVTRGLNRNHNPILKSVFKAAANTASAKPGPLCDLYNGSLARGVREELAKLTLTRKICFGRPATVEERRTLGSKQTDDASDIAPDAVTVDECG